MRHLILPLLLGCSACAPSVSAPAPENAARPELMARLRALSASASCANSAQCRTVPVGAKACGGPEAYLAVSESQLPEAARLAERHAEVRRAANAESGVASTCAVTPDPGAVCHAGHCRTAPRPPLGPGGRAD
ncbi:hypothetical protein LJR289_003312 [Pseudoduganella sp. LjRoot289]|uniref:hypothetical protein n=1 Tax=Pseudoduganella sp. LjRoot289 TaxID=3342314 RepID=UPI003ECF4AF5